MEKIKTMQKLDSKKVRENLASLVEDNDVVALEALMEDLHPSDVADVVEALDREMGVRLLRALPVNLASETLTEIQEGEARSRLFSSLNPEEAADLLKKLSDDDAADLVGELSSNHQEKILGEMSKKEAIEIKDLLKYGEDTAGDGLSFSCAHSLQR